MNIRYYAEAMYGSDHWQVVCEDVETRLCSVIGKNLSQFSARKLADELQAANDRIVSKIENEQ